MDEYQKKTKYFNYIETRGPQDPIQQPGPNLLMVLYIE